MKCVRKAYSLIEVIVVIAIFAILLTLILPAVQVIRNTANRLQSVNNLKQIGLAMTMHHDSKGRLPGVNNAKIATALDFRYLEHPEQDPNADFPLLRELIRIMDPALLTDSSGNPPLKVLTSPGDPSFPAGGNVDKFFHIEGPCSYGLNMTAFEGRPNLTNGFPDGTSQTIAATERYAVSFMQIAPGDGNRDSDYKGTGTSYWQCCPGDPSPFSRDVTRRATFADRGFNGEVIPITSVNGGIPTTKSSVPGQTFQVRPALQSAWSAIPQTPYSSGLPTLFFDGSVRTISGSVDPSVFWGAVTRDRGEVLSDW